MLGGHSAASISILNEGGSYFYELEEDALDSREMASALSPGAGSYSYP